MGGASLGQEDRRLGEQVRPLADGTGRRVLWAMAALLLGFAYYWILRLLLWALNDPPVFRWLTWGVLANKGGVVGQAISVLFWPTVFAMATIGGKLRYLSTALCGLQLVGLGLNLGLGGKWEGREPLCLVTRPAVLVAEVLILVLALQAILWVTAVGGLGSCRGSLLHETLRDKAARGMGRGVAPALWCLAGFIYGHGLALQGLFLAGYGHGSYLLSGVSSAPLGFAGASAGVCAGPILWAALFLLASAGEWPRRMATIAVLCHYAGLVAQLSFQRRIWVEPISALRHAWGPLLLAAVLYLAGQVVFWTVVRRFGRYAPEGRAPQ